MVRIQRKRRFEEDKDTHFSVRGRPVLQCNIDRWQKRQKGDSNEPGKTEHLTPTNRAKVWTVEQAETPSDIFYETPSEASRAPSEIDASTPRPVMEQFAALPEDMPDFSILSIAQPSLSAPPARPVFASNDSIPGSDGVRPFRDNEHNKQRDQTPTLDNYRPEAITMEANSISPSHYNGDCQPLLEHNRGRVYSPDSPDSPDSLNSITEIDRDEFYSSDSSNSSVVMIDADEYTAAVGAQNDVEFWNVGSGETKNKELRAAARLGNTELVRRLLESGAEIESRSQMGKTALHAAVLLGHIEVIAVLLQHGADISSRAVAIASANFSIPVVQPSGRRRLVRLSCPLAIHIAASTERCEVINLLLRHGADLEATDAAGNTALLCAIRFCQDAVVTQLLDSGARCDVRNDDGRTPLFYSVLRGHEGYVRQLLTRGVDIQARGRPSLSPLLLAVSTGHEDIVRLLVEAGGDIDKALEFATGCGYEDMVGFLLDEHDGETPKDKLLLQAVKRGHTGVLQVLADRGANFHPIRHTGENPLTIASMNGHCEVVRWLLDRGADIESHDFYGTALWRAAEAGHRYTVELLLDRGANIESRSICGSESTALWEAAKAGHRDVVKALLDRGANIESQSLCDLRSTALLEAAKAGHRDVVELLLERGAKITYRDDVYPYEENTALRAAVIWKKGDIGIVKLLLGSGADIEGRSGSNRETALLAAVSVGNKDMVKFLLASGADIEARDWSLRTPLSLAAELQDEIVAQVLLENGAATKPLTWREKAWLHSTLLKEDTTLLQEDTP